MTGFYHLAAPLIWALDPEKAHAAAITALKSGLLPQRGLPAWPQLEVKAFGLSFPNPLGVAAGLDKQGEAVDGLLGLGFGFTEAGTVTPRPQPGNPKPRLFRLPDDRAIINRFGFNSQGHQAVYQRLAARADLGGIVGVNIGANKDTSQRSDDYVEGLKAFHEVASYLTVNISSPNTKGLRALQSFDELSELAGRLGEARRALGSSVPLLLKIAPDLDEADMADIAKVCLQGSFEGLIVSNTTIERPPLRSPHKTQSGGLSGRPLFSLSTRQLARMHQLTRGKIPLIGAGGIDSVETAWRKICAGASLLQLYSGLVYEGPGLVRAINKGLARKLKENNMTSITEATGSGVLEWLAE